MAISYKYLKDYVYKYLTIDLALDPNTPNKSGHNFAFLAQVYKETGLPPKPASQGTDDTGDTGWLSGVSLKKVGIIAVIGFIGFVINKKLQDSKQSRNRHRADTKVA